MTPDSEIGSLIDAALLKREGAAGRTREGEARDGNRASREILERYGHPVSVRKDRALYYQGDAAESTYLLIAGSVRSIKYKSGDRPFELPPAGIGEWLGLAELETRSPYRSDAVASEPCVALEYSRYNFGLARSNGNFASYIAGVLARQVLELNVLIEDESPEEKIISFLLSRRRDIAGIENARISVTQERMARAIGVTRETVNKRLGILADVGILRVSRGAIEAVDWEALVRRREDGG